MSIAVCVYNCKYKKIQFQTIQLSFGVFELIVIEF